MLGFLRAGALPSSLEMEPSATEDTAKQELEATLAARQELGPAHDSELIAGFLERIDREIDRKVEQRVAERTPAKRRPSPIHPGNLALCIPIIAVAGGIGGTVALIITVLALAAVFLVAEFRR
jgi:hypothetical protein